MCHLKTSSRGAAWKNAKLWKRLTKEGYTRCRRLLCRPIPIDTPAIACSHYRWHYRHHYVEKLIRLQPVPLILLLQTFSFWRRQNTRGSPGDSVQRHSFSGLLHTFFSPCISCSRAYERNLYPTPFSPGSSSSCAIFNLLALTPLRVLTSGVGCCSRLRWRSLLSYSFCSAELSLPKDGFVLMLW